MFNYSYSTCIKKPKCLPQAIFLFYAVVSLQLSAAPDGEIADLGRKFRSCELNERKAVFDELMVKIRSGWSEFHPVNPRALFVKLLGKPDGKQVDKEVFTKGLLKSADDRKSKHDLNNVFCYLLDEKDGLRTQVLIDARPPGLPEYYFASSAESVGG